MSARYCRSCAASSVDTLFTESDRDLCFACEADSARGPLPRPSKPARTRASYRARYRNRQKSGQGDLVDLLRPPP